MNTIQDILANTPPGEIVDLYGLDRILAEHWHNLNGSGDGGMEPYKLIGRMEDSQWNPPILSFIVERHGGTVCGSTRAELQHWKVDLDAGTAEITKTGHRQLEPMATRISIKGIADEIAQAILKGDDDKRFSIDEDNGDVVVNASTVFRTGSGFKRTVEGRRMRLCKYIADIVADHGWQKVGWNKFRKDTIDHAKGV